MNRRRTNTIGWRTIRDSRMNRRRGAWRRGRSGDTPLSTQTFLDTNYVTTKGGGGDTVSIAMHLPCLSMTNKLSQHIATYQRRFMTGESCGSQTNSGMFPISTHYKPSY